MCRGADAAVTTAGPLFPLAVESLPVGVDVHRRSTLKRSRPDFLERAPLFAIERLAQARAYSSKISSAPAS